MIFLTSETGYIIDVNNEFKNKYIKENKNNIENLKINKLDIFPLIENYSDEDLEKGVDTIFNTRFNT